MLALWAPLARAAETPIPPPPEHFVTDTAGFLSEGTRRALSLRLADYQRATGRQVVVWIGKTTGGPSIEEWAVKAFEKWKVGRKGLDDGVLLIVMAQDRKLKFEIGYGLEGDLPDIAAGRIIGQLMEPRLRAGDHDGAITAGIDAVLKTLGGEKGVVRTQARPAPPTRGPAHAPSIFHVIFFVIAGIIFVIILITNPSLALYLLWALSSGGRGGGGGGWNVGGGGRGDDDSFSGGGGRSGGGGASGSW